MDFSVTHSVNPQETTFDQIKKKEENFNCTYKKSLNLLFKKHC